MAIRRSNYVVSVPNIVLNHMKDWLNDTPSVTDVSVINSRYLKDFTFGIAVFASHFNKNQ
jgi:hypothetical protein